MVERPYDHFVWQASAFLEGQAAIRYPAPGNEYFQDVLPIGTVDGVPRGLIPFPPLPALILLPFVAARGLATDDQLVFAALAAITVGICWWMLGRLPVRWWVRLATTIFFAFGTVFWYSAQLGTTWYQAHIAAVALAMLAVGVALGGDRAALSEDEEHDGTDLRTLLGILLRDRLRVDARQFAAGLVFGLACTARLPVVFAAPFFMLVGSGGSWWRRSWSAGLGAVIPVGALLAYNLISTGHLFHPAYEYLYQLEAIGYWPLGYRLDWAIEDARYIPQNLPIMLLTPPVIFPETLPDALGVNQTPVCTDPEATRGLFDVTCPLAVPQDIGMSLLLTSPALLFALPALRAYGASRAVTGAAIAILLIALVNLMHFSQGWVQFGYRFSNDFIPWALLLVALGIQRVADRVWGPALLAALVGVSILTNAWGVAWGNLLGW
jgi:hypothetical protein